MIADAVLDWLLEEDQPAVRAKALTVLLGRSDSDPEVRRARARIPSVGWAAEILAEQDSAGWWESDHRSYVPKYRGTNWRLLILADLGMTREHPSIAKGCDWWVERTRKPDGGFGADGGKTSHLCVAGNSVRALVQFGYGDTPWVRDGFEWLVSHADTKGGWSCYGSGRLLDSWEPLSALAAQPREKWTPGMAEVERLGAEFFLERELHHQGGEYAPWSRTHYPVHYYYDMLVGLDALTSLGHGADPRLDFGLDWLRRRQRPDGRWNLDALHPDVEGSIAAWIAAHPKQAPIPWGLEVPGQPSKLVTLTALRVLRRVELARGGDVRRADPARGTPRAASRAKTVGVPPRAPRRVPTRSRARSTPGRP
ncbi:MAG: terpene cyclase/mutase family protein [Thermoplasmata archaeon]|nr:terpene cyclase/mutase family protein [Thermoplasmata archaeon]